MLLSREFLFVALLSPAAAMASVPVAGFGASPLDTVPARAVAAQRAVDAEHSVPMADFKTQALEDAVVLGGAPAAEPPAIDSDMSSLYFEQDVSGTPILRWDARMVAFDTVVRGETREHTYRFENVGAAPATIAIASACTCTTLEWTRGEIGPGEAGEVHAVFDSSDKSAGELITIDVILEESAPSGNGIVEQVGYTFEIAGGE